MQTHTQTHTLSCTHTQRHTYTHKHTRFLLLLHRQPQTHACDLFTENRYQRLSDSLHCVTYLRHCSRNYLLLTLVDMEITKLNPNGFPLEVYMSDVPYVFLTINDCIEHLFLVDTGATASYIKWNSLATLCLQRSLEPCNPEYREEGSVKVKLTCPGTGQLISEEFRLWYAPMLEVNILGLDFLKSTCSVLDLDAEYPTLRLYRFPKSSTHPGTFNDLLLTDVCINGFKKKMILDTGASKALVKCSQEEASDFQLNIEETEKPRTSFTFNGPVSYNTIARNVMVEAYGR